MQKLIKNSTLLTRCMIIALAAILCVISIIYFIQSYSYYSDEYGTDISFDSDTIVLFLCSIALLIYGIYSVYADKKNISTTTAYYACFGIISILIAFYPLGRFFRALSKGNRFVECQDYLYMSILGIVMIAYLAFSYLSQPKIKE